MTGPVDEWAATNQATFERIHHTLARAQEKAGNLTVAVESADGGVRVVVGADKLVRAINIDEKAYRGYDESQLAHLIVDACQHAKKRVTQAEWQIIDDEFGVTETGEKP